MKGKLTNVILSTELRERARRVCGEHQLTGGISQLIRMGLEEVIERYERRPPGFRRAWDLATNYAWCPDGIRFKQYGVRFDMDGPHIHVPELAEHIESDRWDYRTWQLIQQQQAENARRGWQVVARIAPPEPATEEERPTPEEPPEEDGELV